MRTLVFILLLLSLTLAAGCGKTTISEADVAFDNMLLAINEKADMHRAISVHDVKRRSRELVVRFSHGYAGTDDASGVLEEFLDGVTLSEDGDWVMATAAGGTKFEAAGTAYARDLDILMSVRALRRSGSEMDIRVRIYGGR